ncbi:MAG TPA: ABC transporter ATP-binding protein [Holophagaceae bacterium]
MFEIRALEKHFGDLKAVQGISFSAGPGEILGLLGPNGAGKTTTVAMIAGLLPPDSGQVLIDGRSLTGDTDPLKRRIGLVPQDLALIEELSARDNLAFFGALYGLKGPALRAAQSRVFDLVGLTDRAGDRVATFSGGMKRRLNLAAALLHDPEILLLDEPTVGVDPQSRNAIFENLEALKAEGRTLIYTTHYMEEVERLCGRVVIIDRGRVLTDASLADLTRSGVATPRLLIDLDAGGGGEWLEAFRGLDGVGSAHLEGSRLSVGVTDLATDTPRVLEWLTIQGRGVQGLASERASLESVFLTLTGRSLRE